LYLRGDCYNKECFIVYGEEKWYREDSNFRFSKYYRFLLALHKSYNGLSGVKFSGLL